MSEQQILDDYNHLTNALQSLLEPMASMQRLKDALPTWMTPEQNKIYVMAENALDLYQQTWNETMTRIRLLEDSYHQLTGRYPYEKEGGAA